MPHKGYKQSKEHREKSRISKLGIINLGDKNPRWKGTKVGYNALHAWVKRHLLKSDLCEKCNLVSPYDLANKGIYNRDFKNWEWLCRKCHMLSDGRLSKIIKLNKSKSRKSDKYYKNLRKEWLKRHPNYLKNYWLNYKRKV